MFCCHETRGEPTKEGKPAPRKNVRAMVVLHPRPRQISLKTIIGKEKYDEFKKLIEAGQFKTVADFVWGKNKEVLHKGIAAWKKSCLQQAGQDLAKHGEHMP